MPTVMAIREQLMEYYKGGCGRRVTHASNIVVRHLDIELRGRPNYERVRIANNDAARLFIGDVIFLTLGKDPQQVTFHTGITRRSKQFRAIDDELVKFFTTYLPGVVVVRSQENIIHAT